MAIQHAVRKHDIKKLITFHAKIKMAESFNELVNEHCFDLLKDFNCPHVNGGMIASTRSEQIDNFRNSNKGILTNARCLTEGVDIPVVDMIAFLCGKKIRIDIVQAVGGVMRKSPGKKIGYVLILFYIDADIDENTLEERIKHSDYAEILHVLKVLSDYDDNLSHIINSSYEEAGEFGCIQTDLFNSKLNIIAPNNLDISLLRKSITTITVKNIGNQWNYYYGLIKKFKNKHGHCNVPSNSGYRHWLVKQRTRYRRNDLSQEHIEKLDAIGFNWDPVEAAWQEKFYQLKYFKKQYNHCDVPKRHPDYAGLGGWLCRQRKLHKIGKLSKQRVSLLTSLGMQ